MDLSVSGWKDLVAVVFHRIPTQNLGCCGSRMWLKILWSAVGGSCSILPSCLCFLFFIFWLFFKLRVSMNSFEDDWNAVPYLSEPDLTVHICLKTINFSFFSHFFFGMEAKWFVHSIHTPVKSINAYAMGMLVLMALLSCMRVIWWLRCLPKFCQGGRQCTAVNQESCLGRYFLIFFPWLKSRASHLCGSGLLTFSYASNSILSWLECFYM